MPLRRLLTFLKEWHFADLQIEAIRHSPSTKGSNEFLSADGANASLMVKHLHEHNPDALKSILEKLKQHIPGLTSVEAAETIDGRVVLRFQDGAFQDAFLARDVSGGTLKLFGYLVLLHAAKPHPLLCIEDPETHLYPKLLQELAEEFRDYAERGGQVFVTTHSPDFRNALSLDEVLWLEKGDGFSQVRRATDVPLLQNLAAEGDLPGTLWRQGLFPGADPP